MKIGLRIPGEARKLSFEEFCRWCAETGFGSVDVGVVTPEIRRAVEGAGLVIGSSDMPGIRDLLSADTGKQQAGAEAARNAIRAAADHGVKAMFCCFIPEDAARGRKANYEIWKQTIPPIAEHAASLGVSLAMEGWPGGAPHYPSLGCTPEMWRVMFADCPSPGLGLNYDPSHLVRLGIDHMRVLDEFGSRIRHVHAKDTEIDTERLYEHGNISPTFRTPRGFSESWWRYTIPGDGVVDWKKVVARLEDAGFNGVVSVELEDYRYHGSWEAQAEGLRRSQQYLAAIVR